jgi:hypothetical protein
MKEEYRKSAVDLTDLAIGLVVLGIVVSIGAVVLVNVRNSQVTNLATTAVTAETITPTTAGATFTKVWGYNVVSCNNVTQAGVVINSGNWTTSVDPTNGLMKIYNTSTNGQLGAYSCNYTVYDTTDARYLLADKAALGLGEYGNWFKIIVIVGIAAVVLALIFMAFGGRSSSDGAGGGIGGTY